ncbi:MAG: hypothetical protein AAGB34_05340 [Planctomycetota bacterium]
MGITRGILFAAITIGVVPFHAQELPREDSNPPLNSDERGTAQGESARVRALVDELANTYRRLFELETPEQRGPLLARLIASEHAEIVEIGADFATKLLLNAESPGAEVAQAATDRLDDPKAEIRRKVASLLANLDPAGSRDVALAQLVVEKDPTVAVRLLELLAAAPKNSLVLESAAGWVASGHPPASRAAARLLNRAFRDGFDVGEAARALAAESVARIPDAELDPDHVKLLGWLGRTSRLVRMLESERPGVVIAAATRLAQDADQLDRVIAAAGRVPMLDVAARAIAEHQPTAEGFARFGSLPAGDADNTRLEALQRQIVANLPLDELALVLQGVDAPERTLGLTEHIRRPPLDAEDPLADDVGPILVELIAGALLATDDASGALSLIDRLDADQPAGGIVELEVAALLATDELDRAVQRSIDASVPASAWREAISRHKNDRFALEALAAMRDVFSAGLNEELVAWISAEQIRRQLSLNPEPADVVENDVVDGPNAEEPADADPIPDLPADAEGSINPASPGGA